MTRVKLGKKGGDKRSTPNRNAKRENEPSTKKQKVSFTDSV